MKRPPLLVIGGYLGAGKTSLLNALLAGRHGLKAALLVNDFGSVNIDADLIRHHDGATISLANGCICCSLQDGFAVAIGEILRRSELFDILLIEASGVADPARIAQYGQMFGLPLDGIVVLADAEQIQVQAGNKYVGDTVLRQLAQADLLVLNKIDLVEPWQVARVREWLHRHAPSAPIVQTVGGKVPLALLTEARRPDRFDPARAMVEQDNYYDHRALFETRTIELSQPVDREAVERFATNLGPDIYRAKGFIWLRDDPDRRYVYQQVGSRWTLSPGELWDGAEPGTNIVLIGCAGAVSPAKCSIAPSNHYDVEGVR